MSQIQDKIRSSNQRKDLGYFDLSTPDAFLKHTHTVLFFIRESLDPVRGNDSRSGKEQVRDSREDIAAGHFKRFKNVSEYLKSLDEDTDT